MKLKIQPNYLVFDLLLLIPITTLFQGIVPIVNRLIFFFVILNLFLLFLKNRFSLTEILFWILFSITYVISFFITDGMAENKNEYFYLLFFMLYSSYVVKNQERFTAYCYTRKAYIKKVIIIWNTLVFVSMFLPISYGNNGVFFSFAGNTFRSSTAAIFVLSLISVVLREDKRSIVYAIMPMFCILAGGARTYLGVGVMMCLLMYYSIAPSRKFILLSLLPVLGIALLIVSQSNIMDEIKFSLTVSPTEYYQDRMVKFTSGRSLFWVADWEAFVNGSIFNQIFGFGYNYVYDINQVAINSRIWAHNDYLNILLNYGLVGLFCYLHYFTRLYRTFVKGYGLENWVKFTLFFIWFFNAFFNMYYTYACACASYPFILFGITSLKNSKMVNVRVEMI